MIQKVKDQDI